MVENIGLRSSAVVISAMFLGLSFLPVIGIHVFYMRKRQQTTEDDAISRAISRLP